MNQYRFQLQPYKGRSTRFQCPNCGDKYSFSRYIDTLGEVALPETVGRCNREHRCGYNFTAYEYLKNKNYDYKMEKQLDYKEPEASYLDVSLIEKIRGESNFTVYLERTFGKAIKDEVAEMYRLGRSKVWDGATVFWQISRKGLHAGKIMHYGLDGKRSKGVYQKIDWVHSRLRIENFNLSQTLFGMHLTIGNDYKVNIVESESTAIFMTCYSLLDGLDTGLWLASGGSNGARWYSQQIFTELGKDREIEIHPDKGKFSEWEKRIEAHAANDYKVKMNDYVEKNAAFDNEDYRDIFHVNLGDSNESVQNSQIYIPDYTPYLEVLRMLEKNGYTPKRAKNQVIEWVNSGFVTVENDILIYVK